MTLNDIIVSALAQLDRGHDAQTMDVWRDKFTRFANDAVTDICAAYTHRCNRQQGRHIYHRHAVPWLPQGAFCKTKRRFRGVF